MLIASAPAAADRRESWQPLLTSAMVVRRVVVVRGLLPNSMPMIYPEPSR